MHEKTELTAMKQDKRAELIETTGKAIKKFDDLKYL